MVWLSFVLIGLVFGVLAGACAFLIVFEEMRRHKLVRHTAFGEAMRTAIFAFAFFAGAAAVIGFLFRAG